jgi:hypothetical protein
MTDPKNWTITVEEGENGDLVLPFPVDLLNQMGWAEGTELWWDVTPEGQITLKEKKEENE